MKTWDSEGNVTEEEVSLNKVDPSNATYVQMAAYSAYAAKQKLVQNADGLFLAGNGKSFVSAWIIFMIKWILHRL